MCFFLRTSYLFDGVISFSGLYNVRNFTQEYFDDLALLNSPIDLAYTLNDENIINIIKNKKVLVVVSYGAWDQDCVNETRELEYIFSTKGIHTEFYYWSNDYSHDFPSWNYYLDFYISRIL